ncbi:MAG: hypothetical protein RQ826_13665, partial [Xanthomonadales bacterium]|nr:hypothetical protein [Xanthomonadales bacterium]
AVAWLWFNREPAPPAWDRPLKVVVYPENADGSAEVDAYIDALARDRFEQVETWFADQARNHGLELEKSFELVLAEPVQQAPGAPDYGSLFSYLRWALQLRFWYWTFDDQGLEPDITVVARYRTIEWDRRLHSLGIDSMNLAIANLQADPDRQGLNNVLLAHEILHTVGASDKYDRATGLPRYPEGYADPDRQPRYPQSAAEIMAGKIPAVPGKAVQAEALSETVIGTRTASEVGWLNPVAG